MAKLIPPSRTKCQCWWPESSIMTLGPRPTPTRCNRKVVAIITETNPGSDGKRGSMGVCQRCLDIALKRRCEGQMLFDTNYVRKEK